MQRIRGRATGHAFTHLALGAVLALTAAGAAQARVTRIVIDERQPVPAAEAGGIASERIAGRAFGELDPALPANAIVNDIERVKDRDGKVRYVATFVITKPVDLARASGLMWHEVPNRGGRRPSVVAERANGDIDLTSAWQGDNAGATAVRPTMGVALPHWLQLPIARNADGSPIEGLVFGRIVNRSGPGSQPLIVQTNPVPYKPASLDTRRARLVSRVAESTRGEVIGEAEIAPADWAWARCDAGNPFPGTPDATQICLKNGFDASRLYMVTYTSTEAYALGIGFAAWRDVGMFFKTARADDSGTANPVAGAVTHSIARGVSQSGNFLRGWLHLGFNQDEAGQRVHDGLWPIIAGRRIALDFRWAQPDGVLELYQAGSEGPQWWLPHPDPVRGEGGGAGVGLLDRCTASGTCPKIVEHFGSAEVWALKLTPEWVGTDGKADLPLPPNVRRYYIGSSNHGSGAGGFDSSVPGAGLPATGPACPGNNYGTGVLPANPMPHTETVNAIRVHFRNWVMKGVEPPASRWPRLADGTLAPAHKAAIGFPTLPRQLGLRPTVPEVDFIMPVLDYDWGPGFVAVDGSGIAGNAPPPIRQVLPMFAPKVDADGNEKGGVPVVLREAPLGTYLGWNITAGGARPFHQGQICNYVGGMIPFARTAAERKASGDPRLSLEERYGTHDGYVEGVRKAAERAINAGFLLQDDATRLIREAGESRVLR
ncbi:MAG: alpha/beta hydrolase domain-containing protein [Rubrivivax sp.]